MTATVVIGLVLTAPAEAASFSKSWKAGHPPCYTRSYDAKHLAAHPRQLLTSFKLGAGEQEPNLEPGIFVVYFSYTVKGHGEVFENVGYCRDATAKTVRCTVESDGGNFSMSFEDSGLLLHISRIATEGETEFSPELGVEGDDRLVRLLASPASSCRSLQ